VCQCFLAPCGERDGFALSEVRQSIGELSFAPLDSGDALGELGTKPSQLLLGGDANRLESLLLGLEGDGLLISAADSDHVSMISGRRTSEVVRPAALGGALEALLCASPANDLVSLTEPQARLLEPERVPEVYQPCVEVLDLGLHSEIEPVGETMPELLPLFREEFDLGMDVRDGHAG
jgi:hypothetical protein